MASDRPYILVHTSHTLRQLQLLASYEGSVLPSFMLGITRALLLSPQNPKQIFVKSKQKLPAVYTGVMRGHHKNRR